MINSTCRNCGKHMNGGVYRQPNKCPFCLTLQDESKEPDTKKVKVAKAAPKVEKTIEVEEIAAVATESVEAVARHSDETVKTDKPIVPAESLSFDLDLPDNDEVVLKAEPTEQAAAAAKPKQAVTAKKAPTEEKKPVKKAEPTVTKEAVKEHKPLPKQAAVPTTKKETVEKREPLKDRLAKRTSKPGLVVKKLNVNKSKSAFSASEASMEEDLFKGIKPSKDPYTNSNDPYRVEEISVRNTIPTLKPVSKRFNEERTTPSQKTAQVSRPEPARKVASASMNTAARNVSSAVAQTARAEAQAPAANAELEAAKAELNQLKMAIIEAQATLSVELEALEEVKAEREFAQQMKAEAQETIKAEMARIENAKAEADRTVHAATSSRAELDAVKAKIAELECEYDTLVMLRSEIETDERPVAETTSQIGEYENVMLTSESPAEVAVQKRIGLVSAECILDMAAIEGHTAANKDFSKDQNRSTPNVLKEARKTVLDELKQQAFAAGGNAVLSAKVEFSELTSGGKPLLLVVANGMAVVVDI